MGTKSCGCTGKRLYRSYGAAVGGVLGGMRKSGNALRIYRCPNNRGWHLTKQRKREAA
jgi:hypothetical protein